MKKILMSILMVCSVGTVFAAVDNQYMTTPQFMQNTGYSTEMSRLVSVTNQDPYREPYKEDKNFKTLARRVYHYIVPGQGNDLDFYNHSGDYNGWSWKDY